MTTRMRMTMATGLATGLCLLPAGCTQGAAAPASTRVASSPSVTGSPAAAPSFTVTRVASFDEPWAMTFLPGTDQLLISLRGGELLLRNQATGALAPVAGVPDVVVAGQGGLGDVVAGPTFAADGLVYLSWVEAGPGGTSGAAVGRARLELADGAPALRELTVLWRQQPKRDGSGHFGHRIAFSPDRRHLFISSGERQAFDPAQDLSGNLGKIVRLNLDGSTPADNPFATRGGVAAEVWSYGHRNPLGLAFAPDGTLWESEMGPRGGDEVNVILPGRNYGWPLVSDGTHYDGRDIPDHAPGDGFEEPRVSWNPSISPGSLLIYTGTQFPEWVGDAFIGALSGTSLIRVDLDGSRAAPADRWGDETDPELGERIRAVQQGPDGALWVLQDGRDAALLRLDRTAG